MIDTNDMLDAARQIEKACKDAREALRDLDVDVIDSMQEDCEAAYTAIARLRLFSDKLRASVDAIREQDRRAVREACNT